MIRFDNENNLFYLDTKTTSYVMGVFENKVLLHLYWGQRLINPFNTSIITAMKRRPLSAKDYGEYSTNDFPLEYSTFGSVDMRLPAFDAVYADGSRITRLVYADHIIINGKPTLQGLPATYCEANDKVETLTIRLHDDLKNVDVYLSYTVFEDFNAITRSVRIVNNGDRLVLNTAMSATVDYFGMGDCEFLQLDGHWCRERNITRRNVVHGNQNVESRYGASSAIHNPFMAICGKDADERKGEVYGFSLVYSGNFTAGAELDPYNCLRTYIGINPFGFNYVLENKEEFQTPEAVLVYSSNGFGEMSRIYHIWTSNQDKITDTGSNALQQTMSNDLIITKDTPVGQWLTYTASFTAEIYDVLADASTSNDKLKNVNALALGFVTGDKVSVGTTVYVDDFTVEKVKDSNLTTITVHTNGVNTTQVFKGVPGDKLPNAPTRKDFIFEGFYSDAALKNPVTVAKFPTSGNLDLYAKWKSFGVGDSITIGFDDYNYISGSKQFYPWYSLNKTDSADGDGVSVQATMGPSCSTTMRLAYKGYRVLVEDGVRYLVSFSYKNLDEIPNKWTIRIYANSPLNGGIGTVQQSNEDALYRLTLSKAAGFGTWKRHTYSFTGNLSKYQGHNAFAINMQTNSFSEVPYIRALFDNVTITKIADDDIVCMTNTLAGPDYVVGKKDQEIKLPTNMKVDGYKFRGWYLDSTFTMDATGALFSEDTVIYAKWAKIKLTQDFEDYNYVGYGVGYDMDIEYYTNKVTGYDSKNVYSGKSSIHRLGNVSSDKKFTLITDANDKIALGETYKITFYVKLISTKNAAQNIFVLPTDSYFYPGACDTDMAVSAVSLEDL